MFSNVRILDLT